jgi:hypothetical protein
VDANATSPKDRRPVAHAPPAPARRPKRPAHSRGGHLAVRDASPTAIVAVDGSFDTEAGLRSLRSIEDAAERASGLTQQLLAFRAAADRPTQA